MLCDVRRERVVCVLLDEAISQRCKFSKIGTKLRKLLLLFDGFMLSRLCEREREREKGFEFSIENP